MSEARAKVRARSIVGLYRQDTIESLSIGEVNADLRRLGVDPSSSIEFAKGLAEGGAEDPASTLLRKLDEAEAVDAEIAEIGQASIEKVLSSLPEGFPDTVVADALERVDALETTPAHDPKTSKIRDTEQELAAVFEDIAAAETEAIGASPLAAAEQDNAEPREATTVMPVKRRRRSVLGWGTSLVGIAASVLVFVAVRPDVLEQIPSAKALDPWIERLSVVEGFVASVFEDDASLEVADGGDALPTTAVSRALQQPVAESDSRDISSKGAVNNVAEPSSFATDGAGEAAISIDLLADAVDAGGDLSVANEAAIDSEEGSSLSPASADGETDEPLVAQSATAPIDAGQASRAQAQLPSHVPLARPVLSEPSTLTVAESEPQPQPLEAEALALAPADEAVTPAPEVAAAAPAVEVNEPSPLPDNLTGVFVVDADRVPADLNALESSKRDDRLAAKLGEASLRALGQKVIALIAFERDGRRVEAALVEVEAVNVPLGADAVIQSLVERGTRNVQGLSPGFKLLELPDKS